MCKNFNECNIGIELIRFFCHLQNRSKHIRNCVMVCMQLANMKDRLDKLRAESKELDQFRKLDNERRAIEYLMLDREGTKNAEKINEVLPLCLHTHGRLILSGHC
jgi:hypothetical protein